MHCIRQSQQSCRPPRRHALALSTPCHPEPIRQGWGKDLNLRGLSQRMINLPVIHDVKAAGLTAMELASLIRQKLEGKILNPQVTVTITEISNPSALPLQAAPKAPVHPDQSPSPDLRQSCCVAREGARPFVDAPATLPYTINVEMVLKPAESPQSHS
jgi:hypothetical protein